MDNIKNDKYYLDKILENLTFVIKHTKDISLDEMGKNPLLIDSIMFRLVQISENSDRLSSEFINKYGNIPWKSIKGMRNRIVHDYGMVDLSIIYNTVKNDLPKMYRILKDK